MHKLLAALSVAVIFSFGAMTQATLAQDNTTSTSASASSTATSTVGGPVDSSAGNSSPTTSASGDVNDMGPGTLNDIYGNYLKRMRSAANFSASQYGGSDVIQGGKSLGPGTVVNSTSGPVQMWPAMIPTAVSTVPTFRDQGITKNLFQTFGYPVSDTQFQVISRYNDNILLEQMFSPERAMWMANAIGNLQATKTANNTANLAQNQATSAIEHIEVFLTNFTNEAADPGNMWHQLLNNLFIPMAILLLLVGAVIAQVLAIAAQGTSVLGNISPFDGLQRSVIAVFLIPFTQLIMSWSIDVANSISLSIPTAYYTQFGRDMYQDAICAQKKAFPVQQSNNNLNAIIPYNTTNSSTAGTIEGMDFDILGGWNPCLSGIPTAGTNVVPDEAEQFVMTSSRLMCNMGNSTLTITWNVLCAFQTAYLYYLWCMGPIVAALWVWPMQQLRNALPQWIEGLITLCFWGLFWNTSVLLMACFYGINTNGDTGTMYMTALNLLANLSVKFAFNFSGLTTSLGFMAENAMMSAASGGGTGGAGGGQRGGAGAGAGAHHGFAGGEAAHGGHPGGVGAGAFVPGQGQVPGGAGATTTAGELAGAGTSAGAVGAGGLATTMGSAAGFGAGTDTTAGGVLTGTGFGTGLAGAPGGAAGEASMAGASDYLAAPGGFDAGGAIGAISPALSGAAAPGAFDAGVTTGAGAAAGAAGIGELGNPGVSPIDPGAAGVVGATAGVNAGEFNPAISPVDINATGVASGTVGASAVGNADFGSATGQLVPGGFGFVPGGDGTGTPGLGIGGDAGNSLNLNPADPLSLGLSANDQGFAGPPLSGVAGDTTSVLPNLPSASQIDQSLAGDNNYYYNPAQFDSTIAANNQFTTSPDATQQIPASSGDLAYNANTGVTLPTPDAPSFNATVYPDSSSSFANNYNVASDAGLAGQTPPQPVFDSSSGFNTVSAPAPSADVLPNYNMASASAPDVTNYNMASAAQAPDVTYYNTAPVPPPDTVTFNPVAPTQITPPEQQVAFADIAPQAPIVIPSGDQPMIIPVPIPASAPLERAYAAPPEPVYVQQQQEIIQQPQQEQIVASAQPAPPPPPAPAPIVQPQQPSFSSVAMTPPAPPTSASPTPVAQHEEEIETAQRTQPSSLQEILAGLALRRKYRRKRPDGTNIDDDQPPSSLT